jgi:hypothetical protein
LTKVRREIVVLVVMVSSRFTVMAGLVPAIHVFLARVSARRGCLAQGRA